MSETTGALADVLGVDPTLKPTRPPPAPGVAQPRVVPDETGSVRDLVLGKGPPTVTPARDPDRLFTSRGYTSLYDIPGELFQTIKKDLTPQFHWPWNPTPTPPPPTLSPGAAGVVHGLKTVRDTVTGALAPIVAPVSDVFGGIITTPKQVEDYAARTEQERQARNKEFKEKYGDSNWATAGEIGGQFLATAPLLGPLGKAIQAGSKFIPGLGFVTGAKPAASTVGRGVQLATEGGIQGAEFGALTSGQSDESVQQQMLQGALGGAVASPLMGALLGGGRKLAGLGGGTDVARAELAAKARDELGVHIPVLERPKSAVSGTQMADVSTRRSVQRLIMEDMGEATDRATPAVMDAARARLDKGFNDLTQRVQSVSSGGTALSNDLTQIAKDLADSDVGADAKRAVQRQIQDVIERFYGPGGGGQGQITANGWLALTAKDGRLEKAIQNSTEARPFLISIRDTLNARLVASAGPEDAELARTLRRQWRVMKTVEDSQPLPGGDISFNKFATAVDKASQRYDPLTRQYRYDDQNRMNLIARVGREFLGTQPDSTTAARLTGSSFPRMAMDAVTRALTAIPQTLQRSPWSTQNAINTALGRPPQGPIAAAIPAVEPLLGPAVALGAGDREVARRRQRELLGQ